MSSLRTYTRHPAALTKSSITAGHARSLALERKLGEDGGRVSVGVVRVRPQTGGGKGVSARQTLLAP